MSPQKNTLRWTGLLLSFALGLTASVVAIADDEQQAPITPEGSVAIFAGGCFWCVEADFEKLPGVLEAISGYTGGSVEKPSYKQVTSGKTGHVEAVLIRYDEERISYRELLDVFWRVVDPTDPGGQFADRGSSYRVKIFYTSSEQRALAEASRAALSKSSRFDDPIVTAIEPASWFYPAESYHQDYYKKNEIRYQVYRKGSGRDRFIEKVWGKKQPRSEKLKEKLSPMQYRVTQENGTEPAFSGAYWNFFEDGIYVDVVSGEPLFSSRDKFKSGTGWPSFTGPIAPESVTLHGDSSLFMTRTEVRSAEGNSHLGHVFNDGPEPTGKRYCINSAALRFISRKELKKEGYGALSVLFD